MGRSRRVKRRGGSRGDGGRETYGTKVDTIE